jgi:hypothetical protein
MAAGRRAGTELVGFAQPGWLRRLEDAFQIGSGAVFEAPAFVAGLDDLPVMGQSIEHGGGHFGVAEVLWPIREGEVRRDDDRGVFVRAC